MEYTHHYHEKGIQSDETPVSFRTKCSILPSMPVHCFLGQQGRGVPQPRSLGQFPCPFHWLARETTTTKDEPCEVVSVGKFRGTPLEFAGTIMANHAARALVAERNVQSKILAAPLSGAPPLAPESDAHCNHRTRAGRHSAMIPAIPSMRPEHCVHSGRPCP